MNEEANNDLLRMWLDDDPQQHMKMADEVAHIDDSDVASELLAHGMLSGLLEPVEEREYRVQNILDRFDSQVADRHLRGPRPSQWRQLSGIAAAAVLLIGAGFWFTSTPLSAEAAIDRVIRSVQFPVTRIYAVKIFANRFGRDSVRECKLYNHGMEKTAAVFENAVRSPAVIGADGERRWMVIGQTVWTSDGAPPANGNAFRQRLVDLITRGHVEINSLLTQIPSSYDLRLLPPHPLPGQEQLTSQPIEATLSSANRRLPQRIVIWPHPDSGVVTQMHVFRGEDRRRGANRMEFVFEGEKNVPDAFFTPDFHRIDR